MSSGDYQLQTLLVHLGGTLQKSACLFYKRVLKQIQNHIIYI